MLFFGCSNNIQCQPRDKGRLTGWSQFCRAEDLLKDIEQTLSASLNLNNRCPSSSSSFTVTTRTKHVSL